MRERLGTYLAILERRGQITQWHDGHITGGAKWEEEILRQLDTSDIILLLLSADFFKSDFCWNVEYPRALQRHADGSALVIPVILKASGWQTTDVASLQVAPRDGKPIDSWEREADALDNVREILELALKHHAPVRPDTDGAARLPSRGGTVFGRDAVTAEIVGHLEQMTPVVLKGFGGVGKSTVADLVRHRLMQTRRFATIVWVDLRDYRSSAAGHHFLHSIFDQIEREIDPGSRVFDADVSMLRRRVESLLDARSGRTLLIFDNYESIFDERSASDSDVGAELDSFMARAALSSALLITTRVTPNCGIRTIVKDIAELDQKSATAMIEQRGRDIGVSLAPTDVREICRVTHRIPKLIEFVVGFGRSMPISEIAAYLLQTGGDRRAAGDIYGYLFHRAWEQLKPAHRRILMAMVLFTGQAPSKAMQSTADADEAEFWHGVRLLEQWSLLEVRHGADGDRRYGIHPLTQQFCEAALREDPDFEGSSSERFVQHYADWIEQAQRTDVHPRGDDLENVMAAMRTASARRLWPQLLRFRDPVNRLFWRLGLWQQRVEADHLIYGACKALEENRAAASVLIEDLGYTFLRFENIAEAEGYVTEGLGLLDPDRDHAAIALATRHLGKAALLRGEYETPRAGKTWDEEFQDAETHYRRSGELRESAGSDAPSAVVAIADLNLDFGRLYWLWGRKTEREARASSAAAGAGNRAAALDRSQDLYDRAMRVSEQAKHAFAACGIDSEMKRGTAKALGNFGNVRKQRALSLLDRGRTSDAIRELEEAERCYSESLAIAEQIQRVDEIAHADWGLGEIYKMYAELRPGDRRAQLERALQHAERAYEAYRKLTTPNDVRVTGELHRQIAAALYLCDADAPGIRSSVCIEAFYPSRDSIPPLAEFLRAARSEISILGLALNDLVPHHLHALEAVLKRSVSLQILMMSPLDYGRNEVPWLREMAVVSKFAGLTEILKGHCLTLHQWHANLDPLLRSQVEIGLYPTIPTATMVLIDRDSDDGFVKLESTLYGVFAQLRPSYLLRRARCRGLFEELQRMFERLWKGRIVLDDLYLRDLEDLGRRR